MNYTISSHEATRKARLSKTVEDTLIFAPNELESFVNYTNANYNSNQGANNGQEMTVPFLLWKLLPPETRQDICDTHGDPVHGNL